MHKMIGPGQDSFAVIIRYENEMRHSTWLDLQRGRGQGTIHGTSGK
jgi:hypothetical protein